MVNCGGVRAVQVRHAGGDAGGEEHHLVQGQLHARGEQLRQAVHQQPVARWAGHRAELHHDRRALAVQHGAKVAHHVRVALQIAHDVRLPVHCGRRREAGSSSRSHSRSRADALSGCGHAPLRRSWSSSAVAVSCLTATVVLFQRPLNTRPKPPSPITTLWSTSSSSHTSRSDGRSFSLPCGAAAAAASASTKGGRASGRGAAPARLLQLAQHRVHLVVVRLDGGLDRAQRGAQLRARGYADGPRTGVAHCRTTRARPRLRVRRWPRAAHRRA